MELYDFIDSELFIAIPVLYVLGMMIKKSSINDKFIPIILGAVGILLALAYKLAMLIPTSADEVFDLIFKSVTQGVLCAACSVYANNLIKQFKKENENASSEDREKGN